MVWKHACFARVPANSAFIAGPLQVAAAAGIHGHTLGAEAAAVRASSPARGAGLLSELAALVRAEGVGVLFRGWTAKVARLGPGSAIILTTHAVLVEELSRRQATSTAAEGTG